jgi:hypothetical protein
MNLPEYSPSNEIWHQIEAKLNDEILQKSIERMPVYEPEEKVWQEIEQQLSPKIIGFKPLKRASVAAVLVLFFGFYFLYNFDNQALVYSEENIDQSVLLNPADDSDKQYEQIIAFCKTQTYVCENPDFKTLKTELDELQIASNRLKEAIGQYNTEAQLTEQLTDLEQQKTIILRKMALKI